MADCHDSDCAKQVGSIGDVLGLKRLRVAFEDVKLLDNLRLRDICEDGHFLEPEPYLQLQLSLQPLMQMSAVLSAHSLLVRLLQWM